MAYDQHLELWQHELSLYLVRTTRAQVRVGRHWRRDTWEQITYALDEVGGGMREAGPIAASYYATILSIALEYLADKPNSERAHELKAILSIDFAGFLKYCSRFSDEALNPTEKKLLADARIAFSTATLQIHMLYPDTA